ncbi:MAG: hypothetical protein AAF558_16070 [Verrucomicrobiota bacterium]
MTLKVLLETFVRVEVWSVGREEYRFDVIPLELLHSVLIRTVENKLAVTTRNLRSSFAMGYQGILWTHHRRKGGKSG